MTEREQILERVRKGLEHKAPRPGHDEQEGPSAALPPSAGARQWLPAVGESFEERLELFRRNIAELRGEFHLTPDRVELAARLGEIARAEGWKRVGLHRGPLIDEMVARLPLEKCRTDEPYRSEDLEQCDAGITECDALIAQTGSILLTGQSAGGRALSVLPPHHVVLALRNQLVRDLPEALSLLKKKYSPKYPSFISFITGPSRTGDIERILVLGAHGPKRLTILCV